MVDSRDCINTLLVYIPEKQKRLIRICKQYIYTIQMYRL